MPKVLNKIFVRRGGDSVMASCVLKNALAEELGEGFHEIKVVTQERLQKGCDIDG